MALSLPSNPDLERFRRDARRLQHGVRDGDPQAVALVARHHPSGTGLPSGRAAGDVRHLTLAEAQLVLARSYGFASWPRLRDYLRRSEALRRDPAAVAVDDLIDAGPLDPRPLDAGPLDTDPAGTDALVVDRAARAVPALACLRYDGADEPSRWARATDLLERHPDLPQRDVFVAATVGDPVCLSAHLDADAQGAVRSGGPFDWPPLLYLAYSRVPQKDSVASARVLLDAGADPDSGYLWQGLPTPFTVLTGVFGEGESGPGRQPRHPAWRELAGLLLERGADPNDRQTLYNRMFGRDDSHLELLLDHGLGRPAGEVWAQRLGVAAETLEEMMTRQLHWAASHGFTHRTALLAKHGFTSGAARDLGDPPDRGHPGLEEGADLDALRDGRTALHQAALMGDLDLIRHLLESGADPRVVDATHGTTPAHWAQWARHDEAEQLLRTAQDERERGARQTAYGSGGEGQR
jgi:ankyrin repeat protein